jgi:hypothetical protein
MTDNKNSSLTNKGRAFKGAAGGVLQAVDLMARFRDAKMNIPEGGFGKDVNQL